MKLLTQDALLVCDHVIGAVQMVASQSLVTVEGRRVLVATDPEARTISSCPNIGATIKPCQNTLVVREGYSEFIRIEGDRVCLDTVTGFTDGTPPASVNYSVRNPGQTIVDGSG
jgi:hypothetical protein